MAALTINHSTTTHQLHSRVHRTTMTMPTTRMAANCAKDDDNKTALAPFWTVDSVDSRRRPLLEWSFKSSKDAVAAAVDSRLRPPLLLELSFNSATAVAAFESTSGDIRQLSDCCSGLSVSALPLQPLLILGAVPYSNTAIIYLSSILDILLFILYKKK